MTQMDECEGRNDYTSSNDNSNQIPQPRVPYNACAVAYGLPLPAALDPSSDVAISAIAAHLWAAATGSSSISNAVTALRTFLAALPRGDLAGARPELLKGLSEAAEPAFRRLVLQTPHGVTPDVIAFGMSSLQFFVDALRGPSPRSDLENASVPLGERLEMIALLADELDASERRRRLDASGHQLARLAKANAVFRAADPAALPLQ